jgi:hypothetical protein
MFAPVMATLRMKGCLSDNLVPYEPSLSWAQVVLYEIQSRSFRQVVEYERGTSTEKRPPTWTEPGRWVPNPLPKRPGNFPLSMESNYGLSGYQVDRGSGLYLWFAMTGLPPQVNSLSFHLEQKTPVSSPHRGPD